MITRENIRTLGDLLETAAVDYENQVFVRYEKDGIVYEIKCHQCEMSIRSQGQNIRSTYARMKDKCCLGCGNKELVVRKVDMSKAPKREEKKE